MSTPRLALLGLAASAAAGCGAGRGDLSGAVTFQGKPVASGSVTAVGADGLTKTGFVTAGRYEVRDVAAGRVALAVTSPDPGKAPPRSMKGGPAAAAAPPDRAGWFPLPDQYADPAASGLSVELKSGANAHDIVLK